MIEFIEKVERQEKGSRILSENILCKLGWSYISHMDHWLDKNDEKTIVGRSSVSESLDSALLLIQNGWGIADLWEAVNPKDRPWWGCNLRRDEPYMLIKSVDVVTPALVLCGAILRVEMEESLQRLADLGQEMNEET